MSEWDVEYARSEQAGGPVLAVTGEIDLSAATRFGQELAKLVTDANNTARVDMSRVPFIDSSGVRELLAANRAAAGTGIRLVLVNPSIACRRVLEISGVLSDFAVEGTPDS